MKPNIACRECNEIMMRTENGAVLCPNGHGRVMCVSLSARQFNVEARQIEISRLPVAKHVKCGRWEINDRPGVFYKVPKETPGCVTCACERVGGRVVLYLHTQGVPRKPRKVKG